MNHRCGTQVVALAVALSLLGLTPLAGAESTIATLAGVIRSADRAPLSGARLVAMDPETGQVVASEPTAADGNFILPGLPSGSYELAVARGEMLFLVESPLYLVAGVTRHVQIVVDTERAASEVVDGSTALPQSLRDNAVLAVFLVIVGATFVGEMLENITDDELRSTPLQTN